MSTGKHNVIVSHSLMTYFSREQKEKILRLFTKSLVQSGFIFLDGSETLPPSFHENYGTLKFKQRVYQRF
ncbi:MAG: CheR family methyltransferase [Candidatus Hodarchaeota archaeon]